MDVDVEVEEVVEVDGTPSPPPVAGEPVALFEIEADTEVEETEAKR